jgi:acetyltransferase-like isoleucine patch superfamily enzyme
MSLRSFIVRSDHPLVRAARSMYHAYNDFSLPVPRPVAVGARIGYQAAQEAYRFGMRTLVSEPLFKAYCTKHGRNLHTGSKIHYVHGQGDIILGDDVLFDGHCGITFAHRYSDRPQLVVGNDCGISHNTFFTIGKSITLGNHVRIASGVRLFDSPGHPIDADARRAGQPPSADEVKPIVIEDDVWIGRDAVICPGVRIGQGAVVSLGSVVVSNVAPFAIVAGNPARVVGSAKKDRPAEERKSG